MNQRQLFRQIIDGCDEALKEAFIRRMDASIMIAKDKIGTGSNVYDPAREEQVLANISGDLNAELALKAQSLWRSLMRMSRNRQYQYFVDNDPGIRLPHEDDVTNEDSVGGIVACLAEDAQTIGALLTGGVLPCASLCDAIDGLLGGKADHVAATTESFFRSDWLLSMIYKKRIYINGTYMTPEGKNVFLLSPKLYDLPQNDRISIVFSVRTDIPGSLAQALEVFSDQKINLEFLRYETRYVEGFLPEQGNYVFVDFCGRLTDNRVRATLLQLERELPFFRVLGYRSGK